MATLLRKMLSPDLSYFNTVFKSLFETIEIALIGSLLGIILSIPFVLLSAINIAPSKILATILNKVFAIFRTIPSLIWAAILVSIFSVGKFSGIIALTIIAFLISHKLLREYVETISTNRLNSVISIGANKLQILKYCVFPEIKDNSISTFFIVLESNIRSALILGMVGAGGIGQILWTNFNHLQYSKLGTIVLVMFFSILFIDIISLAIRKYNNKLYIRYKSLKQYRLARIVKSIINTIFIISIFILAKKSLSISSERFLLGINQAGTIVSRMLHVNLSYIPNLLQGLSETLFIAIFATFTGAFFAMFFTYFDSYNSSPAKSVSILTKALINLLRTFPPMITAIIFFRGVGPGKLAGALALSVYTTGVLTKMYSEAIENVNPRIKESIAISGANRFQIYVSGLVKETMPTFISLLLYRLESNIRNSTILGIIGAGGIGYLLNNNITWRYWENVGLLVLGTSLMIGLIDVFSSYVRNHLK